MTITFIDLYNECAGQAWSRFDNDAESVEDFESALKIAINKAISEVWNLKPWSFREDDSIISVTEGRNRYTAPNGAIVSKTIDGVTKYAVKLSGKFLDYEPNFEILEEEQGTPKSFYLSGSEDLYLYPTPDNSYTVNITYHRLPYGLSEDGEELYELKNDTDYIDISERYEVMFKDCVVALAMVYAIASESDENHSGYQRQYEDALDKLIQYTATPINKRRFTW